MVCNQFVQDFENNFHGHSKELDVSFKNVGAFFSTFGLEICGGAQLQIIIDVVPAYDIKFLVASIVILTVRNRFTLDNYYHFLKLQLCYDDRFDMD